MGIMKALFMIFVILTMNFLNCGSYVNGFEKDESNVFGNESNSIEMTLDEKEIFGEEWQAVRSMAINGDKLYALGYLNMDARRGAGYGIRLWIKELPDGSWDMITLYETNEIEPSMVKIFGVSDIDGSFYFTYAERSVEGVFLGKVNDDYSAEIIFFNNEDGTRFLNPIGSLSHDGKRIDLLVPDRAENGIRWFQLDSQTAQILTNIYIETGAGGSRIYDLYVRDDGNIDIPVAIDSPSEAYMLRIYPDDMSYRLVLFDTGFEDFSPSKSDTARNFDILPYPDKGIYIVTYLRPAEFSHRYMKGLLGEFVAYSIDMETHQAIKKTTIGGFTAEEASTHYIDSAKVGNDYFVIAYTTVNDDHVFHRTEEHSNYVEGRLELWKVSYDGSVELCRFHSKPPFWAPKMIWSNDGYLYKIFTEATEDNRNAMHYERWKIILNCDK